MQRSWGFDGGRNGFRYEDDLFRFTSEPAYAKGTVVKRANGDGYLELELGGRDDDAVRGMSGGWTKSFGLEEAQDVTLSFRYKISQSRDVGRNEYVDLRVEIDGEPLEIDGRPYVARIKGDGPGGKSVGTGWRTVEIELGALKAGDHEIAIGGYANAKRSDAVSRIRIDDVGVEGDPVRPRTVRLDPFEKEVLRLTNAFREKHDLDAVEVDANLNAAAENWSREMAKGDFFHHSSLPNQFTAFGYEARGYGENIAAGYPTPKAVVQGWIDSPGHRKNLLREDFEHIGIGYHKLKNDDGDAAFGHYWTQIFADPANDYYG